MQRVNYIPRTLVGNGGVRLYDIPGVIYPAYMLSEQRCLEQGLEVILDTKPEWGISTRAAADILRCLPSSARNLLHRKRVRHCRVKEGPYPPTSYWDKRQVKALAVARKPVMSEVPARFVMSGEAMEMLSVSRNTMNRYVNRGMLQQYRMRLNLSDGARLYNLFLRSEVRKLACLRRAVSHRSPRVKKRDRMDVFLGTTSGGENPATNRG